jgi:hypothetical protein
MFCTITGRVANDAGSVTFTVWLAGLVVLFMMYAKVGTTIGVTVGPSANTTPQATNRVATVARLFIPRVAPPSQTRSAAAGKTVG